jgi:hypothetical protein
MGSVATKCTGQLKTPRRYLFTVTHLTDGQTKQPARDELQGGWFEGVNGAYWSCLGSLDACDMPRCNRPTQ